MPEIRIRAGLPCKGVSLPTMHVEPDRWYDVDEEVAAQAAALRLHATSPGSPLLFEVRNSPQQVLQPEELPDPAPVDEGQPPAAPADEPAAVAERQGAEPPEEESDAKAAGEMVEAETEVKPTAPERRQRRGSAAETSKTDGGR